MQKRRTLRSLAEKIINRTFKLIGATPFCKRFYRRQTEWAQLRHVTQIFGETGLSAAIGTYYGHLSGIIGYFKTAPVGFWR